MATDDHDTNPSTPAAKKSSGQWTLNLDSAPCARCKCRRDAHRTIDGGSHRWDCMNCGACPEFVIGGVETRPDYDALPDTLPQSSNPPPKD